MKTISIWLVLAVAGLAGCGYMAKFDYARNDRQRIEAGERCDKRSSQERVQLEIAADLDRKPPKANEAAEPVSKQLDRKLIDVTVFIGGIHYHGDMVIEPARRKPVPQPARTIIRRDERCERLRQEHDVRLADWHSRFD